MHSGWLKILILLLMVCCLGLNPQGLAAQTPPQDHAQIYKRAVAAVDSAEKKLAGNYTAEAKSLIKEANSLFGILQKEMPEKMKTMELTSRQEEQWNVNNKMGEDSSAQGQRLEQSGLEKQRRSDQMEAQGQQDMAVKLQQEAVRELNLSQKAHLRAAIYHLRNLELTYNFLNR
ncbi:MAG: hypothetical protein FJ135_01620 [Deltaproteobacteria bacterium]|nr:hypothetical protein [Deltaproteobacteria bacterium]